MSTITPTNPQPPALLKRSEILFRLIEAQNAVEMARAEVETGDFSQSEIAYMAMLGTEKFRECLSLVKEQTELRIKLGMKSWDE